jgi:hypothetical protein
MRRAVVLLAVLLAAPLARAQRQGEPSSPELILGVYVPETGIATIGEKAKLVSSLAQSLSQALAQPVVGRSYAKAEDLVRDASNLSFVVIDAPIALTPGLPFSVLAVAKHRGRLETRLCVYATEAIASAAALDGKRLAYPRLGPVTNALLDNFLFERFFSVSRTIRVPVPDAASALTAVRVGKADAAVLTEAAFAVLGGGSDLRCIVMSRELPLVVFGKGAKSLGAHVVARASAAMVVFSAPSIGIDGFARAEEAVLSRLERHLTRGFGLEPSVPEPRPSFHGPTFAFPVPDIPLPPLESYLVPIVPPQEP